MLDVKDMVVWYLRDDPDLRERAHRIARRHANTWQKGRRAFEKASDILVGKVGERAWEYTLDNLFVTYVPWDEIRTDNFTEHAPLDGFMARCEAAHLLKSPSFLEFVRNNGEGARFVPGALDRLARAGIYGYEVKSTRVADRHRKEGRIHAKKLLDDRFLMYPAIRQGTLTPSLRSELLHTESRKQVAQRVPPVLVQVHVDDLGADAGWKVYVAGYIHTARFLGSEEIDLRTLYKEGKSEQAIYYALPLRKGSPVSRLAALAAN
jgi:hypothetical protein